MKRIDSGLFKKYALLATLWSALIVASLSWNLHHERRNTLATSTAAAKAHINRDMSFRKWATFHGGVYVPPTEHTPPNPYLRIPGRDVITTEGKALTLMNPAYILREIQSEFTDFNGVRSHITSLNPINPFNAPDPWEREALLSFERGEKERMERQEIDGVPHLRMMLPFLTEPGCLKCHAQQGYRIGDIRGGISTTIPLLPFLEREREMDHYLILSHAIICIAGIAGLGIGYGRSQRLTTARKTAEGALRESELRFRSTFEQAAVGIAHVAPDGRFLNVNSKLCEIVGYSKEDLLHLTFQDITHPDDLDADLNLVRRVLAHEIGHFSMEKRYRRKEGAYIWVNITVAMVSKPDGSPGYFISVIEDIDKRKAVESELVSYRSELESRVQERTDELLRKNRELEIANADLESFSYSVSHDLRAPLRAIDSFAAIIQEEYAKGLDDEGRRLFGIVRDNAQKMRTLINDILAFSRAGRHEFNFMELDVAELAREVWRSLEAERTGRSIEFHIGELPRVCGDPSAVRQVLQNLLSNGIKFTRGCEPAIIEIGGSMGDGESTFYVKDNGTGFDMAGIEKLFGLFQRLHSADEFEGTGLGLAIVKRVVLKHGGRVWAEGRPGEGATFWFTLPSFDRCGEKS